MRFGVCTTPCRHTSALDSTGRSRMAAQSWWRSYVTAAQTHSRVAPTATDMRNLETAHPSLTSQYLHAHKVITWVPVKRASCRWAEAASLIQKSTTDGQTVAHTRHARSG